MTYMVCPHHVRFFPWILLILKEGLLACPHFTFITSQKAVSSSSVTFSGPNSTNIRILSRFNKPFTRMRGSHWGDPFTFPLGLGGWAENLTSRKGKKGKQMWHLSNTPQPPTSRGKQSKLFSPSEVSNHYCFGQVFKSWATFQKSETHDVCTTFL